MSGGAPYWGARPFPKGERAGRFIALASGFPEDAEALPIRTPGRVLGATLKAGESLDYALADDRRAYLVPARGAVEVNGVRVGTRDGAAIAGEPRLRIAALEDAEVVMVDTV
jgi:redox-sensitive bicupin YhaK (pirin superfamily)